MAMYSALRDAFNDMNNMFIDRQNWQAEHKRRAEEDAHRRNQEERAMQRQEMQNEITAVQVAKARDLITPKDFSVYSLGDPNHIRQIMSDPKARDMMTKAVDDEGIGYKFSEADGGWVAPDGSRLQMSKMQAQNRAMAFYGIIDMHDKAPEAVQLNLLDLQSKKKGLLSERKKYEQPGNKFVAQKAEIDTQLSAINAEITRSQQFLDPSTGEMFKYYTNKSNRMRKRAIWAQSVGADALAGEFSKASSSLASNAALAMKAMLEKPTKTGTKQLTWYANEDGVLNPKTGKAMKKNQSFTEYIPVGAEGLVSRDGFSNAKVPDGDTGGKWGGLKPNQALAHNRAVKESGEKVLTTITLPNGQMLPKTEENTKLYMAANREYSKTMRKAAKGRLLEVGEGDETAQFIIDKKVTAHLDGYHAYKAKKQGIDPATGKPWTAEDLKAIEADIAFAQKELGYTPNWELELKDAE